MSLAKSPNINALWGQLLIEELIRNGVDHFFVSPGSRSSPFVTALAANPKAKTFVHYDERGSAFAALGYTAAAGRPGAVISTSGTAAANFLPAIIETSQKKLPLIVITADRPPELRKTGADQTIEQVGLFGSYVRWQADLPCPTKNINPAFVLTTVDQAVHRAKGQPPGPVHLNCMFREPLAPVLTSENFSEYLHGLHNWEKRTIPYTAYIKSASLFDPRQHHGLIDGINSIKNGLLVVGKLKNREEQEAAAKFASKLNWPVFADITSGLRLNGHKNVISYFDQILLTEAAHTSFDGVLHLGGRITSKRYYQFIQKHAPDKYIMVLNHPLRNDPLHTVSMRVEGDIKLACQFLNAKVKGRRFSPAGGNLFKASQTIEKILNDFMKDEDELNEPAVARLISQHIPNHSALFLASSMPIRDMDMYAQPGRKLLTIGANRGASGIDGTIATAAGFTLGHNTVTTLLIGDLALLHDLNSLSMLKGLPHPLIIVAVNNDGGGIFSFLPIAHYREGFEKFFGTPHGLNFKSAAELFGLHYAKPGGKREFVAAYERAVKENRSTIIEVTTSRSENVAVHQALQKIITHKVQQVFANKK